MLSYAHGACPDPLLGETIAENLERTAARVPDADALISCHQGMRYAYAEFNEATDRIACGGIAAGLSKGDRVGVWSPNRAEWALTQYATAKLGVILVNINPAYRVHELEYALGQSGCRWIIATRELKGSDFVEMVREVRARVPTLERAIFFDTDEWASLADSPADPDALARRMSELDFDDAINIQYTSGTTGFPKGATLSHHNILNNGYFTGELLGYSERDSVCIPVPLYHTASGWCSGTSPPPRTERAWSIRRRCSSRRPPSEPAPRSTARACTGCRRCSSRSSATSGSPTSTWELCGPGSWPARRARSR